MILFPIGFLKSGIPPPPPFTPTDLPGLKLWEKGSSFTGNEGDEKTVWPDLSGNGNDAVGLGILRKNMIGTMTGLEFGSAGARMLGSFSLGVNQPVTICGICIPDPSGAAPIFDTSGGRVLLGVNPSPPRKFFMYSGAGFDPFTEIPVGPIYFIAVFNGANSYVRVNGMQIGASSGGPGTQSAGDYFLGSYSDNASPQPSKIAELIVTEGEISEENIEKLEDYFAAESGIEPTFDDRNFILFDGNSLVHGDGSTDGHDMPSVAVESLGGTENYAYRNAGVSGWTSADVAADLATRLGLFDFHSGENKGYFLGEGINDMAVAGLTPGQAVDAIKAICTTVRAAVPSAKIVVATITPWAGGGPFTPTQEAMETARQSYNQMIRDEPLGTYWDGVADVGADETIGAPGANFNETYFTPDHTHLINAGYLIYGTIVGSALNGLFNPE